ncbi:ATP-binding cassette domain-containing protein [Kibdelosporangium philippinense]|uniref:ATP-binding cassette domain-containing protein n=1 Tax=Kibdelosporangium philippinense TaxID=211113 RepID=A0ABS8ZLQ3_9PSEU|nr:ATP-binding cassette domain-containing protein [Kibdelosporangium philippinense]MCE7008704.1 ATP-binding cassette domain-containing protein [Kibdelosporangium philippinense]
MIKARGLARQFRTRGQTVEAVQGVDIDVAPGELVGFLGPNGAGKSTTLRMLTTLLRPTAGEARVAGCDLLTDPAGVRKRIGYVAQGHGSGDDQKVIEEATLQARFYGLPIGKARHRVNELFESLELTEFANRTAGALSGGQKRRLDIAMGVLHIPRLLFLDEPSAGLDPQSRSNLWGHIRALHKSGTTIFLTTHYLDEADALCDRIMVIDHGKIVAEGTPDELKSQVAGDLVQFDTDTPSVAAEITAKVDDARELHVEGNTVRFRVPRGDTELPGLLRALDQADVALLSVQVHRPTLDDVFLTMTGRSLREAANA